MVDPQRISDVAKPNCSSTWHGTVGDAVHYSVVIERTIRGVMADMKPIANDEAIRDR